MDACNRVNDLADTVQTSLDTLDQAQLDSMMQDLPEITAQLKKVDVDALNKVLTELPADGHRQQPADTGTEHLELVQQLRVGVWTVN